MHDIDELNLPVSVSTHENVHCIHIPRSIAHMQSDSPTFPLYTEVMGKGKTTAREGEEVKPDLPQKKLSVQEVRELNSVTEEDIPDVPEQNLTKEDEDFRKLDLSSVRIRLTHYNNTGIK